MGIISKTVKVYPRGKTISYYKEKGYDAKNGVELEVKVEDLSQCSTALVETTCDYCGKLKRTNKKWHKKVLLFGLCPIKTRRSFS